MKVKEELPPTLFVEKEPHDDRHMGSQLEIVGKTLRPPSHIQETLYMRNNKVNPTLVIPNHYPIRCHKIGGVISLIDTLK